MAKAVVLILISTCFASEVPKTSQDRMDRLMKIWNDDLTFENRDNFFSHMKKAQGEKSDEGAAISAKEYEELLKLSKQETIPEYIEYDSSGRPPQNLRSGTALETCDKMKGNFERRCNKRFKEIVDFKSEEGDEISNSEWDEFQTLVKKINDESSSKSKK